MTQILIKYKKISKFIKTENTKQKRGYIMELFEQFGIDLGYVVIGMAAVIIILFILLLITMIKDANTRKKYTR